MSDLYKELHDIAWEKKRYSDLMLLPASCGRTPDIMIQRCRAAAEQGYSELVFDTSTWSEPERLAILYNRHLRPMVVVHRQDCWVLSWS